MKQIISFIANYLDISADDIKPDTDVRDLVGDSLDLLEMIIELEKQFELDISDEELDTLVTVQDIQDYLNNNSGQIGTV
jgi:acyl carrier protein